MYTVPSKLGILLFRARNAHLPVVGHRLSHRCVRVRPGMYCETCSGARGKL